MSTYLLACAAMGLGIGFDVVLATLLRLAHISGRNSWTWVKRISFTHILFPMVGYYFFVGLFRSFPILHTALGITAFTLVTIFLFDIIKGWAWEKTAGQDTEPFAWTVVLSVSWDALFSGPAKSAQAIGWSAGEVILSFIISGVVVMSLAIMAVWLAYAIRHAITKMLSSTLHRLTLLNLSMMFLEFVILSYFGILALIRYTFASAMPSIKVFAISFLIGAFIFAVLWRSLFQKARQRIALSIAILERPVDKNMKAA
jgi:hypothetical protein